jgi:hypothetical protein
MRHQYRWYLWRNWICKNHRCLEYWMNKYKAVASVPYLIQMEFDTDYHELLK